MLTLIPNNWHTTHEYGKKKMCDWRKQKKLELYWTWNTKQSHLFFKLLLIRCNCRQPCLAIGRSHEKSPCLNWYLQAQTYIFIHWRMKTDTCLQCSDARQWHRKRCPFWNAQCYVHLLDFQYCASSRSHWCQHVDKHQVCFREFLKMYNTLSGGLITHLWTNE